VSSDDNPAQRDKPNVMTPESALSELCRTEGVLLIVDDCLMFRLAEGGSAERFGI
jgi:glutamate-1-semialdehyde aminotransferase